MGNWWRWNPIREELSDPPELKNVIAERNNIKCPVCGNYGMNYMTKGKVGYGMFGYTLAYVRRKE